MLDHEIFIKAYENHEFNFCGINWWPLIKIQVSYQIHLKNANLFKISDVSKPFNEIDTHTTLKDNLRFYIQNFKKPKSVKTLIVTDSSNAHSSATEKSICSHPYTDPFIYYFQKLKIEHIVFDYKKEQCLLNYDLKVLKKIYLKQVKNNFSKDDTIKLQLVELCDFLLQNYGDDFKLYNYLVQNIINNQTEFLMFYFVLKRVDVKNILLYCYYNNTMMSIIRAANLLKIQTIEYQHSQVTSNHFAYSSWKALKEKSKIFFPSKVWVWRQNDAEYLEKNFVSAKKNNYVVGGNLFLSLLKIKKSKKEDGKTRILVTLQGQGLPDYIIEYLDNNPNLILYLRIHPRYFQDKEICEKLKSKYTAQIEIEDANSLTLHELFNFVDYHLTNFSGAAIEAEYYDLTNIIYGDKGYISYENEIKSGKYLFIECQDDLDKIVKQGLKHKSDSKEEKKDIHKLILENFN
ncbi:hypothetical protein [Flavobacterium mesophilum]|uniref:hypothetical protein n=1 Tax=Flavobacterium mesophilum TaxID=3143495 RepID=UPI0031CDCE92